MYGTTKNLLTAFLTTSICASVIAEDRGAEELAECREIVSDVQRLQCYDRLSDRTLGESDQSGENRIGETGAWRISEEINPIDDSRTVTLILQSESGRSRFGQPIGLVARCQSGQTDVFIAWQTYLGSEAQVLTRVGKREATSSLWGLSTDKQASFYPRDDVEFLVDLLSASKLVAQVTPYNESPITAEFDLTGLATAIEPLRSACGW